MIVEKSSFLTRHARALALSWAILCLLLMSGGALALYGGAYIETSILKLLPDTEHDTVVEQAFDKFSSAAGQQIVISVEHAAEPSAVQGAKVVAEALRGNAFFEQVSTGADSATQGALLTVLQEHAYSLLTPDLRQALAENRGVEFLSGRLRRSLYSPLSTFYGQFLERDPLLLTPYYLRSLETLLGKRRVVDGVVVASSGNNTAALVSARLRSNAFSMAAQESALAALDEAQIRLRGVIPGASMKWTGMLLFASRAASTMRRELTFIGNLSTWGVLAVVLFSFRSIRQLIAAFVALTVGLLFGSSASLLLFSPPHMLTLVFGASLLGVSVDYPMHFFAEHRMLSKRGEAAQILRSVFPAITFGMLTSIVGYLGLAFTPFPGLRQMAVFSIAGLIGTWGTVMFWFPGVFRRPYVATNDPALFASARWYLDRVRGGLAMRYRLVIFAVLGLIAALGLWKMRFNDDIRLLQDVPRELVAQDRAVREPFGLFQDGARFVLVESPDEASNLERQWEVSERLDTLVSSGELASYNSLTTFIPRPSQQREDRSRLTALLAAKREQLTAALTDIGVDPRHVSRIFADRGPEVPLLPSALAESGSGGLGALWLGKTSRGVASMVLLGSGAQSDQIRELLSDLPGVRILDKVHDITDLLARFRRSASLLVLAAYLIVGVMLLWRYGLAMGTSTFLCPILAGLLTLSLLSFFDIPVNLFHLVSLLLVLGMGVDYGIFLAESADDSSEHAWTAMFAILLCSLTTILSFGLLFVSSYPILRSLGLVVSLGITLSFALAPLAVRGPDPDPYNSKS